MTKTWTLAALMEILCCKICKWVHKVLSFLGYNFSVYSDLSKKINKQINKLGHCPGNKYSTPY